MDTSSKVRRFQYAAVGLALISLIRRFPALLSHSSVTYESRRALVLLLSLALINPKQLHLPTKATLAATVLGLASNFWMKSSTLLRWVVTFCSVPIVSEALDLEDVDVPAVFSIVLGLLLNHPSAAAVILIMVTGGEALEEHALEQAGASLHSLLERSPGIARLAKTNQEIPADQVKSGDEVVVKQNEVIPVDGIIVVPDLCVVDERLLTGECVTVSKEKGQFVMAGSTNVTSGQVRIRAKGCYEDSILHQMKSSLKAALERKGKIELTSKKLADSLTPITIIVAGFALEFVTRVRNFPIHKAWDVVLSVMMSATPCPAAIGVPIAMLSGMSVSNQVMGATVKSGEALEAMSVAKVLVLDKTGTITTGKPTVKELYFHPSKPDQSDVNGGFDTTTALTYLAHVEIQAKHVLADAVVRKYQEHVKKPLEWKVEHFENIPGVGVSGIVNGVSVRIGSKAFCANNGVDSKSLPDHEGANHLVSYFSLRNGKNLAINATPSFVTGVLVFEDPIRPEAMALVDKATERGMMVVILSGDSSNHLKWVANKLKVKHFRTCLPHEKVNEIRRLQLEYGPVVMIGDGANDSAALAAADVGISVDPSGMASESAKVVLVNGDVSKVSDLIRLSVHVVTIAKRTVLIGTVASLCQMLVAATGSSSPFLNACIQETIDLGATLHALRALQFTVE